MENQIIATSNQIEQYVLCFFKNLVINFMSTYKRNFTYIDFEKSDKLALHTYMNEFILSNEIKEIKFLVKIIYNKKEDIYSLITDLWIKNLKNDNQTRENFRLKDYFYLKKTDFPKKFEYGLQIEGNINFASIEAYLLEYFSFLNNVFREEDIRKILNSDFWLDVPIDWRPYK